MALLRSLSKGDGKTATTPEKNDLIGWMKIDNRAARAARTLVQLLDVVWQMTKINFLIKGFNDN